MKAANGISVPLAASKGLLRFVLMIKYRFILRFRLYFRMMTKKNSDS